MATVTLTIPDGYIDRIVTALCASTNTKKTNANAKKAIVEYIKSTTLTYERALSDKSYIAQIAAISAANEADNNIVYDDINNILIV